MKQIKTIHHIGAPGLFDATINQALAEGWTLAGRVTAPYNRELWCIAELEREVEEREVEEREGPAAKIEEALKVGAEAASRATALNLEKIVQATLQAPRPPESRCKSCRYIAKGGDEIPCNSCKEIGKGTRNQWVDRNPVRNTKEAIKLNASCTACEYFSTDADLYPCDACRDINRGTFSKWKPKEVE